MSYKGKLNSPELQQFVKLLQDITRGGAAAQKALGDFVTTAGKAESQQARLNKLLSDGETIAFNFGAAVANAARRLLLWACPATFIFSTISALRNAVSELVKLDVQARQLQFFLNGGALISDTQSSVSSTQTAVPHNAPSCLSPFRQAQWTSLTCVQPCA